MLSQSQGFYGRLLREINACPEHIQDDFFQQFEDCKSDLDVILKVEQ